MAHGPLGVLTVAFGLLLAVTPLRAHHSFNSQYDSSKPITLTGIVTKVDWRNPHVYFYLDVKDQSSETATYWGFEMGPPHSLERRGWKRNSMQIGDEVTVEGALARDGSKTVNARKVTLASTGEVFGAASSENQTI